MQHTLHVGADALLIVVDFGHQALLHALKLAILALYRTLPVRAILHLVICGHFCCTNALIRPHQSGPGRQQLMLSAKMLPLSQQRLGRECCHLAIISVS